MFAGHTATGSVLSTTLNVQLIVLKFPLGSVAVRVTVCWPTSAQPYVAEGLVSTALQLSVLEPSPMFAGNVPLPLPSNTTSAMFAGHTATGSVLSTTLNVHDIELLLPLGSVAVRVTVCWPTSAQP